jgi:phenylalanyl-tRNA synthetase alpha chain
MYDINRLTNSLHPLENKVLSVLNKHTNFFEIVKVTGLKDIEVMRALQWLQNKEIIALKEDVKELITLDSNGLNYLESGLPEKRFLESIESKKLNLDEIKDAAKLNQSEIGISLGVLKSKVAIQVDKDNKTNQLIVKITDQGKRLLNKESLEEIFLQKDFPLEFKSLNEEELFAYQNLKKRKNIIKTDIKKIRTAMLTELGKKIINRVVIGKSVVDRVTSSMLKDGSWKGKDFRGYDLKSDVPRIFGGKRHFVNKSIEYVKQIWTELGFKEMTGPILNTSFWNFDSLFVPQDHPAREMQDTFFIKSPHKGKIVDTKLMKKVKAMHEHGGKLDSTGWQYQWDEEEAKKNIMRTHTTILSAKTLAQLRKDDWPAKYFAVGKCFRNETLDWKHLFEFNQVEGIVVDPDANFRNHIGYLREFFRKLGFPHARFRPAYFPYTEMSLEIDVFHPIHKEWIELGGTGIFRPEVVEPLLGEAVPVLAWGPGFDRIIMDYYKIADMRELYKNDIKQLREMKAWLR